MTIREQIIANIKTGFEGILITGGYNLDLGNNINIWKATIFEKDSLPGTNIRDLKNVKKEGGPIGKFRWALQIEAEVFLASGANSVTDARKAISDILRCVGLNYRWGALAIYTEQPDEDEITMTQENNIISSVNVIFSVVYDAPKWEM